MLEETVCERTANAFVEQHEHEGDFVALIGQTVRVPLAMALDESVRFHFADVVAQLGERVALRLHAEAGEDGLVDLGGRATR